MSKPLDLTIFPKVDRLVDWTCEVGGKVVAGKMRERGYETPTGIWEGSEFPEKRLTDAELAAEYQRMCHEFDIAKYGLECDPYTGRTRDIDDACDRLDVLERFATTPSYDEVTA